MAKKAVLFAVVMSVCGAALFAQEEAKSQKTVFGLSAGAGGFIGGDFGGGAEGTASLGGVSAKIKTPYFGGGGFAFFDATYVELTLGIYGGGGKMTLVVTGENELSADMSYTNFNIGLLGKYPFTVNQKLSVFPLLGIEYDICLSVKDKDGNKYKNRDGKESPGDFSALWFKFGGGLDFLFTEKIYLRFEALYGLRLANKFEKAMKDMLDEIPMFDTKTLLGHGLTAKLAAGYKF
jgi:hypothetical protein